MALVEGCKHTLEITVPAEEVEKETDRVVESLKQKANLPGFRPGKVPASMIRSRFSDDIRKQVLETLLPRHLRKQVEKDNLPLVGSPDITDVHFEKGEPLRFKAAFEVSPEFELEDYRGLTVTYREPEVGEDDIDKRIGTLQEQKAEYINVDPRPATGGDYAVVALESLAGVEGKPIKQDELMLHLGDRETLQDFSEHLEGMEPGQSKEFDVTYPEDYVEPRLSGRQVRFHVDLKAIRRKELPEINDEFAKDLGDYQNLGELREAVRTAMMGECEFAGQQEAKNALVDKLIDLHDFPIPELFVQRQMEANVEQRMRELAAQGIDPRTLELDWEQIKEKQGERAGREVKASLLLEKIADREAIETTVEEVDREVQRIANQRRESAAVVKARLEKEGQIRFIASRIRTDKTLTLLFEQARKVAPERDE